MSNNIFGSYNVQFKCPYSVGLYGNTCLKVQIKYAYSSTAVAFRKTVNAELPTLFSIWLSPQLYARSRST